MGGGPRTFPGGLSKWQYRRMQEKLAREKANRLLRTEKQLYLSRLRSGTRPDPSQPESGSKSSRNYCLSSKDRIKLLADRFTKPGAEDLWNQGDGPVSDPPMKLLKNPAKVPQLSTGSFVQKREYSAGRKWRSNPSSEDESESDSMIMSGLRSNPIFSRGALRESEYNGKKEKRPGEEIRSRSREIQQIRDEFRNRKEIARMEERSMEPKGDSLLSKKRFCLFIKKKNKHPSSSLKHDECLCFYSFIFFINNS
jgi:hypothetical protein